MMHCNVRFRTVPRSGGNGAHQWCICSAAKADRCPTSPDEHRSEKSWMNNWWWVEWVRNQDLKGWRAGRYIPQRKKTFYIDMMCTEESLGRTCLVKVTWRCMQNSWAERYMDPVRAVSGVGHCFFGQLLPSQISRTSSHRFWVGRFTPDKYPVTISSN